jgi:hypothetical protein
MYSRAHQFHRALQALAYSPPIYAITQSPTMRLLGKKTPHRYRDLLLHHATADDMTGFDNRIMVAYGRLCPPCKLMEYYQVDPRATPSHFMRGTAAEVWGDDSHEAMPVSGRTLTYIFLNLSFLFPFFV